MGHRTYIMPKPIYDLANGPAAAEAPFNMLTNDDWLTVLHHLHAHEVEGVCGMQKGMMLSDLQDVHSKRYVLAEFLQQYLDQHSCVTTYRLGNNELRLNQGWLPNAERGIYFKLQVFVNEFQNYERTPLTETDEGITWDIRKKAESLESAEASGVTQT
ncbi:MAG: hypothetical protein HY519_01875 [Candidatus Aenigmarchaeota archaeon]|nr:hypothetical protein [Candidatus Aenigmarchaeota archaeon]